MIFFFIWCPVFIWLPKILFSWSNCLSAKVYHCCFCVHLLRLTWHLSSYAWTSHTEKLYNTLFLLKAKRCWEYLLSMPSELSCCQPLNCLQFFFWGSTPVLKYKQLYHTIRFNRNSPQTFRSIIANTEITYASRTPKHFMEATLLSSQDCWPQRQSSV